MPNTPTPLRAPLTRQLMLEIQQRYAAGRITTRELSQLYQLSLAAIHAILHPTHTPCDDGTCLEKGECL